MNTDLIRWWRPKKIVPNPAVPTDPNKDFINTNEKPNTPRPKPYSNKPKK